jgi:hypothetical protein
MHVSGPSEEGNLGAGHRDHTTVSLPFKVPAGKKGARAHPDTAWRTKTLKDSLKKVKSGAVSWKTFGKKDGSEAVVPVRGNIKLHGYSFSYLPKSEAIDASVNGANSMKEAHPSKLKRPKPKVKKKPLRENYRSLEGVYMTMQMGINEIIGEQKIIDEANAEADSSLEVIEEGFFKRLLGIKPKEKPELFSGAVYNQTTKEFAGHIFLPARPHRDEELSYPDNTGMGLHKMSIRGMSHHEDAKFDKKNNTVEWKHAEGKKGNNTLYHHINRYMSTWTEPFKGASQSDIEDHAHRMATDISRAIVQHQSIAHKELEPHEVEQHMNAMDHHIGEYHKAKADHATMTAELEKYKNSFDPKSPDYNQLRVRATGYNPSHPGILKTREAKSIQIGVQKAKNAMDKHEHHYKYHQRVLGSQRAFKGLIGDENMSEETKIDPKVAYYANMIKTSTFLREQLIATRPTNRSMGATTARPGAKIASRTSKPTSGGVPPMKPGGGATQTNMHRMSADKPGVPKR